MKLGIRIRRAWRLLKGLSVRQYLVIFSTILVPVFLFPVLPDSTPVGPFESPEFLRLTISVGSFDLPIKYPAYVLWVPVAVLLLASAFREDRSRTEQSVDWKLKGPIRDIQQLKDDLERTKTDLQEQTERLSEMDRDTRSGFEEAGVTLPFRVRAGGVNFAFDVSQPSVTLHTRSVSRLVRCGRWVKRPALRIWKWFWG